MNRERAKELLGHLPIIQAFVEGKEIEYKSGNGDWKIIHSPDFAEPAMDRYRIKPEPFECWVSLTKSGAVIVHDSENSTLQAQQPLAQEVIERTIHMREVE